jgi:mRNA-degrading endonuclease RelE of RelBE toxin-antitoxin system
MTWKIEFTSRALSHLKALKAFEQKLLFNEIILHLEREPDIQTRNRKLLRANPLADWELRVGNFRVFYTIENDEVLVIVVAIGRKDHNTLIIEGEEFTLCRQSLWTTPGIPPPG